MNNTHPSGLTCVHREPGTEGLCGQCQADYEEDPSAWIEFGPHPAGQENLHRLQEEMNEEATAERTLDAMQDASPRDAWDEIPF